MMDDLISRQALLSDIKLIEKELSEDKKDAIFSDDEQMIFAINNQFSAIWRTISKIHSQPTAYDVDEVVDNLESTDKTPLYENEDGEEIIDYLLEESNVIEIVKRGGKDEIN